MKNHHDKPRDMARSALASSMPVAERRRRIHKQERARVRAVLHRTHDFVGDGIDELEAVDPNGVTGYGPAARREFDDMIYDRRSHDHLGALLRWAHHRFDHDPALRDANGTTTERYFASLLPNTLSGFHARDHIMWKTDAWRRSRYRSSGVGGGSAFAEEVRAAARWALDAGLHAELNGYIRRHVHKGSRSSPTEEPPPVRLLLGSHDVEAFVDELVSGYAVTREAVLTIEFVDGAC